MKPKLSPCLLPQILSFLALVDVNAFCNLLTLCLTTQQRFPFRDMQTDARIIQ